MNLKQPYIGLDNVLMPEKELGQIILCSTLNLHFKTFYPYSSFIMLWIILKELIHAPK